MGWFIRNSVKLFPGFKLNFSKKGVSTTIGPKGANLNIRKDGVYANAGISGTGLRYRQKIGGNTMSKRSNPNINSDNTPIDILCFIMTSMFTICMLVTIVKPIVEVIIIGMISLIISVIRWFAIGEYNNVEESEK